MSHELIRRRRLGLAITGPYSKNRPRRRARLLTRTVLYNLTPYAISAVVSAAAIAFIAALFI